MYFSTLNINVTKTIIPLSYVAACDAGYWSPSGFNFVSRGADQGCKPCPVGYYQPNVQQGGCIDCGENTITLEEASTIETECMGRHRHG